MRIFKIFKPIIWYFDLDFSFSWKWWHNRRVWKQLCNFSAAYFMRNVREGMDFLFASFNKSHIYRWIKVLNPHVSLFLKTFYFSLAALFLIFLGFTAPVRDLRDISNWEWSMSFEQDKHVMFRLPADSHIGPLRILPSSCDPRNLKTLPWSPRLRGSESGLCFVLDPPKRFTLTAFIFRSQNKLLKFK